MILIGKALDFLVFCVILWLPLWGTCHGEVKEVLEPGCASDRLGLSHDDDSWDALHADRGLDGRFLTGVSDGGRAGPAEYAWSRPLRSFYCFYNHGLVIF